MKWFLKLSTIAVVSIIVNTILDLLLAGTARCHYSFIAGMLFSSICDGILNWDKK